MLGHSTGATCILTGFSEIPNFYIENVITSILISPICYSNNRKKNFNRYLELFDCESIVKSRKIESPIYHPDIKYVNYYNKFKNVMPMQNKLEEIMSAENTSWDEAPYSYKFYFSKFPSGTSVKFLMHLYQICELGEFEQFDYGEEINKEKYEGITVPKHYYFFDKEKIPSILIAGKSDKLIDVDTDIMKLREELTENACFKYLEFENMGHYCFLLNNDLMWINFLLKALKDQLYEIDHQRHETINTEEDDPNDTKRQSKSHIFSSFTHTKKEHGNMEYLIN